MGMGSKSTRMFDGQLLSNKTGRPSRICSSESRRLSPETTAMWRFTVRRAAIPKDHRDFFERYGQNVVALMLTAGSAPQSPALLAFIHDKSKVQSAEAWLTEEGDKGECRETRLEILEWAIVVLIVVEIFLQIFPRL
jgi:hypothetical protein